jgi:multiple sugar transport system ATP-binding protein
MTARENMAFALKLRKLGAAEIERRVTEAAEALDIVRLLGRRPRELSGGERQRVALGRALVRQPSVFLFDEPLSNLDAKLRVQMRAEITKLQERLSTTCVYVTHEQVEAMTMGHRIAIMNAGRLQQVGTPLEVYDRPLNLFVANFIGTPPMNFFPATLENGRLVSRGFTVDLGAVRPPALEGAGNRALIVGIRPENVAVAPGAPRGPAATVRGTVDLVEPLGHQLVLHATAGESGFVTAADPHAAIAAGDAIELQLELERLHFFDAKTEERIG